MITKHEFAEAVVDTITAKVWSFDHDQTIDIEIWNGDTYVNTLTVSVENGAIIHNSRGE